MRVYADSSFRVKLLAEGPGATESVAEYRRLQRPRLFYLPLHALEVENAIRHRGCRVEYDRVSEQLFAVLNETIQTAANASYVYMLREPGK